MERHIVHLDLDTFFVSVERLKNGALKGKPVIIGGSSDRGVVASCSYEARTFGVHSAMPMKLARRLCPSAFYVKGDFDSYSKSSRLVTEVIQEQVPLMEKASIDEFYIDMTGMDRFFGCEKFTKELREKIYKQSGLPISCALAVNKLVSKVATHDAKPNGQTTIPFGKEKPYLAPLPIRRMPVVGEKIKLIIEIPSRMMISHFLNPGIDLSRKTNRIAESTVNLYSEQKSIGCENTLESDTINMAFLNSQMVRMKEKVGFVLRQKN